MRTGDFLPISPEELRERGIEQLDFVYIIGDAYVDHPSFGHAIISRVLEANGFSVGIIAQPDWKDDASIRLLGQPRLAFIVSGGNMDSMVNHYSVSKRRRDRDAFSPGGVMGKRPDYATVVYGNLIRRSYKTVPIIIGGIEASLRRLAHYDYWSNRVKRSILLDSSADLLLYGMGERSIVAVAEALQAGIPVSELTYIDGTVYRTRDADSVVDGIFLPDFTRVKEDKRAYAESFYTQYCNTDPFTAKRLIEPYEGQGFVVQNPPSKPLSTQEMDAVYELPYQRTYHPSYQAAGGIPAIEEVRFSLSSARGCFGGCNFCALTFHQGRIIQARSQESLLKEAEEIIAQPDFKGYIHDVGGPTANFRQPSCEKQLRHGVCKNHQCLFPDACKNLRVDHTDYVMLLRRLRALPGVKKVFVRSGIRFDYLIYDSDKTFLRELCAHHISGQLKVAPEHIADAVLEKMGKPKVAVYDRFRREYQKVNDRLGKKQFLVPYLMSSHPGSTIKEAIALAEYVRDLGYMPEQVQDFYPTPATISTCMYYTELDPRTMQPVFVAKNPHEKAMQRALIQYRNPQSYDLVVEALTKAHREDLIGYDAHCLIRPRKGESAGRNTARGQERRSSKASVNEQESKSSKASIKNQARKSDRVSVKEQERRSDRASAKNQARSSDRPSLREREKGKKKTIRNIHQKKKS